MGRTTESFYKTERKGRPRAHLHPAVSRYSIRRSINVWNTRASAQTNARWLEMARMGSSWVLQALEADRAFDPGIDYCGALAIYDLLTPIPPSHERHLQPLSRNSKDGARSILTKASRVLAGLA